MLAAPITAAHFVTANGGNVEPALYVLLLWMLRRRPVWMGAVLGVGFLNREFTIYGAFALLTIDAGAPDALHPRRGAALRRRVRRGRARSGSPSRLASRARPPAGPGTSTADLHSALAGNNLLQVAERLCLDPRGIAAGAGRSSRCTGPNCSGWSRQPLTDFGIESAVRQGLDGSAWLLVPLFGIPFVRIIQRPPSRDAAHPRFGETGRSDFCAYLILVAVFSLAGYLVGRCGVIDFYTMRYELLSVLGAVGLAGWYLASSDRGRCWRRGASAAPRSSRSRSSAHARLLAEYVTNPPSPLKQELIEALDARGIRYGYADYWTAYYVSFMTRERIILSPEDIVKVRTYNRTCRRAPRRGRPHLAAPVRRRGAADCRFWSCKL